MSNHQKLLEKRIAEYEEDKSYIQIRLYLEPRIPELERGRKYTLKQICGEKFWEMIDPLETGRYVALLVRAKKLPLMPRGTTGSNSCLYERI